MSDPNITCDTAGITTPDGFVGMVSFDPFTAGGIRPTRIEFETHDQAFQHRRKVGCGGWVLGRFLFPGTEWTPSRVMLNCPDDGELR